MKPKFYFTIFFPLILLLAACKTASKLYQKGDYDGALILAVKELQKNPGDPEKTALLKNAYQFAVGDHESKIMNLHSNSNDLKWEWIYYEYVALKDIYNAIRKSPMVYETILPKDYADELNTYVEKAGTARIERGSRYMDQDDKQSAKNAYGEFQVALHFKPGDIKIRNMINDAYEAAVTRVVIFPVDQFGFIYGSYNYEIQQFSDELIRNLQNNKKEFVEFYPGRELQDISKEPDHIIKMNFNRMNLGHFQDRKSTREVTKEVVIKETIYRPDSIVKEYGTVKAKITRTNRTINAEGLLKIEIRDKNGKYLWSDNIGGNYSWSTEFSTYTGDERALGEQDKLLVNRVPPAPPYENEIIRAIKNNINNDLLSRLRNFYSRY